ncbi:hypothetical protein [Pseudoxanthomonas indica]|uniref:Uncharacterized protein n=1 Tax=Pseudoxanthomonas indica TaxID=428993 RepID=A0A1T5IR43_9GAMM|nr:hypothetical protein [Pseudoxanthomonas indica]GGD53698.1 hypothetical protein GCM10007235_27450 [Pseudoxanthomonas indica]SKC41413.1 hypothetical protein SAMN06296058_0162 [Pseudoxanthomonas indica]
MQPSPHASDAASMATVYLHVRVLMGFVVGLGLTHLLRHFARIIERPRRYKVYSVHLLWALFMFSYLLWFWWWEYRLSHLVHWNFNLYFFVALFALLLYLLCALIFPESLDDYADYRDYYYQRRQWFFGLLALVFVVDFVDTWIKGPAYFHSFGPEYVLRNLLYIGGCVIAMITRSPRYHATFAVLALLYQWLWIAREFETL